MAAVTDAAQLAVLAMLTVKAEDVPDPPAAIDQREVATTASWLNMIERFFRGLTCHRVRRGAFHGVSELVAAYAG